MEESNKIIRDIAEQEYKYGFTTDIDTETIPRGLDEEVVRLISRKKEEPEWMTEYRLAAFRHWQTMKLPTWAHLDIPEIDFQDIIYYAAPKPAKGKAGATVDDIDPELKKTFDKLGLPRKDILGVTMPGFGTTDRTYNNAIDLMKSLGISIREISIQDACIQHFKDIDHDINVHDVTYENSQARERTQILMDIANQTWGMVVGTGDLSELALGWATYNGDHMSMYGVNGSIPKTLVKYLVQWVAENDMDEDAKATLLDIVDTPISPELIPADENGKIKQKTEDLVGPYELHDFFLYYFLRFGFRPSKIYYLANIAFKDVYDKETIKKWLSTFFRRFFNQQFKRSCLPDGPKVGSISISPRGDWRMPSDASSTIWLKEIEDL